jgi:hypothetical protein
MPWVQTETVDKSHLFDPYANPKTKPKETPMAEATVVPCATLDEKQALLRRVAQWKAEQNRLSSKRAKKAKKVVGYGQAGRSQPKTARGKRRRMA